MPSRSIRRTSSLLALTGVVLAACSDGAPPQRADTAGESPRHARQAAGAGGLVPPDAGPGRLHDSATAGAVRSPASAPPAAGVVRRAPAASPRATTRRIVFGYMDFTGVGHDRGDPAAPVVVINLSDFGCPYCGVFARDVFPVIDREYVQTGRVLFKYIPFLAGSFPNAAQATRAAECAAEQGQFWPMSDRLYETQAEWKRGGRAVDAQMAALAETLPVDMTKYAACYADRHTDARTAQGTSVANQIGVRVTPSFLVDGNPVQGALPLAEFRRLIETALLLKASKAESERGTAP